MRHEWYPYTLQEYGSRRKDIFDANYRGGDLIVDRINHRRLIRYAAFCHFIGAPHADYALPRHTPPEDSKSKDTYTFELRFLC